MFHPAAGRFSSALPWNNYESELVPCQARIAKSRWEFLWHVPSFSAFPDRCRVSAAISRRFPVFAPLSAVQETAWRKSSQPVLFHQKYFTRNARVRASVQMDTNHGFAPVLLGSAQIRPQKFVKNAQKTRHKNPPQPGRPSAYLLVRMLPMAAMTAGETIPKSAAPHWAGRLFSTITKCQPFFNRNFDKNACFLSPHCLLYSYKNAGWFLCGSSAWAPPGRTEETA